jgi:hypothetical protein
MLKIFQEIPATETGPAQVAAGAKLNGKEIGRQALDQEDRGGIHRQERLQHRERHRGDGQDQAGYDGDRGEHRRRRDFRPARHGILQHPDHNSCPISDNELGAGWRAMHGKGITESNFAIVRTASGSVCV